MRQTFIGTLCGLLSGLVILACADHHGPSGPKSADRMTHAELAELLDGVKKELSNIDSEMAGPEIFSRVLHARTRIAIAQMNDD